MKKKVIIALDMSTKNTGYTIFEDGFYSFGEFSSLKPKLLKNGTFSKAKTGGTFDIKIFFNHIYRLKKKYKNCDVTICYATFVASGNFSTAGTLYKLTGVLELVFGKEIIVQLSEGSARKFCGVSQRVSKRVKEKVEVEIGYKLGSEPGKKEAKKYRSAFYKEEAIKVFYENNNYTESVSDDIADSFVMMKYYIEKEEDL